MSEGIAEEPLPRPFYTDGWTREERPFAVALWRFHAALSTPYAPALDGSDRTAYFEAECAAAMEGRGLNAVPQPVFEAALDACRSRELPVELLVAQIRAAEAFVGTLRFADNTAINEFVQDYAGSHARLLARLGEATGSWQLAYVDELARAFFWVGRLMTFREDLEADRVFIPGTDLEQAGVSVEQLRTGRIDERVKRLLWKQTIRAKNAFAQAEPLARELPRRRAAVFKRWWLGGLEVLNEIRRRDYDLWSKPVRLSLRNRVQVRLQARFGRTIFRSQ